MKKRINNEKKSTINFKEIWNNPRYRGIIILGLYFFFFLFVITGLRNSTSTNNSIQNNETNNFEYKLSNIKNNNYHYIYKINLDINQVIYEGDRNGEKELFTKTNNNSIETFYNYNEVYLKNINNVWSKVDNPYLYAEFKNINTLEEILKNATYESKTEFADKHKVYAYKISTTSIINITENIHIDLDDIPNTILLTTDDDDDVVNIELNLNQYVNYKEKSNNKLKITYNFSKFGEIEPITDPE